MRDTDQHHAGGRYAEGTALVVVDVQNDFAHPDGSLYVRGAEHAVARVAEEVATARDAGVPVIHTADWHPPRTPHFDVDGGTWPVHCVADTWGAALHEAVPVSGPVVRKGVDGGDGYSGFSVRDPASGEEHATELERLLREGDVHHVVVVGIATDVCVAATVEDARRLGFEVTVLADATAAVDLAEGDGDRALDRMRDAGATVEGVLR
ncbi:cysteine hydrolase family protein [Euzebya sp.]|uniref:cysteine hydrolase family protein n=1 Tax=Euzebya sp. TaxID=1971409 RepID=UPI0035136E13